MVCSNVPWTSSYISNLYAKKSELLEKNEARKFSIKTKDEIYSPVKDPHSPEIETDGEKRLKKLFGYLKKFDEIGFKRSSHQILFHKAFVGAGIKKILGADYGAVLAKVLKEYDIKSTTSDVIITCPRRFGKTMGLAQFVAALVLTMDGIEISIYSTGKRASSRLIDKIMEFIVHLAGKEAIVKFSAKEILEVRGATKNSIIGSYPSSVAVSFFKYHKYCWGTGKLQRFILQNTLLQVRFLSPFSGNSMGK